jgi:hypothetical protein
VGGPEFVVEVEFAGEGFVAEFDAVGEIAKLELVAGGDGFLLDPVAVDAGFSGFPEVAIAEVAVALHGHDDTIGRQFHPDQAHFIGLCDAENGGFGDVGFGDQQVVAIAFALVEGGGGLNGGPDGHVCGGHGEGDCAAEVGEHWGMKNEELGIERGLIDRMVRQSSLRGIHCVPFAYNYCFHR